MFCLDRKKPIKAPRTWPGSGNNKPRVGLRVEGNQYHLEIEEALSLANRLVDAAEEAEAHGNQ